MPKVSTKRRLILRYWRDLREQNEAKNQRAIAMAAEDALDEVEDLVEGAVEDTADQMMETVEAIMEHLLDDGDSLSSSSGSSDSDSDSTESTESSGSSDSEDDSVIEGEEELGDLADFMSFTDDDWDDDDDWEDLELELLKAEVVRWLMTHRYLQLRENLPKTKGFSLEVLPGLDERLFRQFC